MPVILCPNCKGKLKMPENVDPRRVKCPSCGHTFLSNQAQVEGAPPPSNPPAEKKKTTSRMSSALDNFDKGGTKKKKKEEVVDDFEIIDDVEEEKPKPKRRRDEVEEEEPPRSKRGRDRNRDEVEEDDEPRSRRGRDRDRNVEDDEEDDRDRKRGSRSRRDEVDDEEEDRSRSRGGRDRRRGGLDEDDAPSRRRDRDRDRDRDDDYGSSGSGDPWGWPRLAMFMNAIGAWCMGGAFAASVLGVLISMAGVNFLWLITVGGITAVGYLIVAGLSFGFSIAGPNRNGSLGFAIATLAVVVVRLILAIVIVTNRSGGFGLEWAAAISVLPLGGVMIYAMFRGVSPDALLLILIALEIAQLILASLYQKAAASACKDRGGEAEAGGFVLFWACGAGGVVLLGVMITAIAEATGGGSAFRTIGQIFGFATQGALGGLYVWHGFISQSVSEGLYGGGGKKKKKKRR